MTIEVEVPQEWSPGQALATRALLQQVFRSGFPVITCVRPDATPEQVAEFCRRVEDLIREAGLTA
jgi:hypothetical protein